MYVRVDTSENIDITNLSTFQNIDIMVRDACALCFVGKNVPIHHNYSVL